MKIKVLLAIVVAGSVTVPLNTSVGANVGATYSVTVAIEQSAYDDVKALSDWIQNALPDAPIPDSLSQRGAAAMSDIVAAAQHRVDAGGGVITDAGEHAYLQPGDILRVSNHVLGAPQTAGTTLPVVIVVGQGYATILGRKDPAVPSGL